MRSSSRFRLAAGVLAVGLVCTGCGSSSKSSSSSATTSGTGSGSSPATSGGGKLPSGPIRISSILTSSGPFAAYGEAESLGVKAGVATLNASGGVEGHNIILTQSNDNGDAATAVTDITKELTSSSPPDFLVEGTTSPTALAMCAPLQQAKKVAFVLVTADQLADPNTCGYNFGVTPPQTVNQQAAATYMKSKGYKRVAVLTTDDDYGSQIATNTKTIFPKNGLTITGSQTVEDTAVTMVTELQQLRKTNPDVLFDDTPGALGSYLLAARQQLGWNIPIVGGVALATTSFPNVPAAELANAKGVIWAFNVRGTGGRANTAQIQSVITELKKVGGTSTLSLSLSLYLIGYDSVMLGTYAIQTAGSTSGPAMRTTLESLGGMAARPASAKWVSYSNYSFTPTDHFEEAKATDYAPIDLGSQDADGTLQSALGGG